MPESVSEPLATFTPEQLTEQILAEGPIGLTQAAKIVGTYRNGSATSSTTLSRWATRGVQLQGGKVLKLQTIRVAGRLMTSRARLVAFIAAQNG